MLQFRSRRLIAGAGCLAVMAAGMSSIDATAAVENAAGPDRAQPAIGAAAAADTFADPPASAKVKYRWWVPLAAMDDDEIRNEIRDMAAANGGGFEVVGFPIPTVNSGDPRLQDVGWGTPQWTHKMEVAFEASKQYGVSFDPTIGPLWPATTPELTDINNPALQQQLIFGTELVQAGASRTGALPTNYAPFTPPVGANVKTIGVVALQCVDANCVAPSGQSVLMDPNSATVIPANSYTSGNLNWTAPAVGPAGSTSAWRLFAYYQTASGQSGAAGGDLNNTTAAGKIYAPDHLSQAGAQTSIDYWNENLLPDEILALIKDIGRGDIFEDSLEPDQTKKWTNEFASTWQARTGYNPLSYLVALSGKESSAVPPYDLSGGMGDRVREDYQQTFSDLYVKNRVEPLKAWANSVGLDFRAQPYGMPIDTSWAASKLSVPESETFGFGRSVERMKTVSSGGHLAGSAVISSESHAVNGGVWATTAGGTSGSANLDAVYRSYVAGVTQTVWHGYPYLTTPEGTGPRSMWPGNTFGGNTYFSESFGPRMPQWDDYAEVNQHLARLQYTLRQGTPDYDVAVYRQKFDTPSGLLPASSALSSAGYTSEYLSPQFLNSDPDAEFKDGEIFSKTSGYNALVLLNQQQMSLATARKIRSLVTAGMPLVIVGDLPTRSSGFSGTAAASAAEDQRLARVMDQLYSWVEDGVHKVSEASTDAGVPAALKTVGVVASTEKASKSPAILSIRRQAENADYYMLYNTTAAAATDTVTLQGSGRPYKMDTFSGKITPIAEYTADADSVTLEVTLKPAEILLLGVGTGGLLPSTAPSFHAEAADVPTVADASTVSAVLVDDAAGTVKLSDGRTVTLQPADVPAQQKLASWQLKVNSWTAPSDGSPLTTVKTDLDPVDVTPLAGGDTLPWLTQITPANGYGTDLSKVSGIGTYTTTVTMPTDWKADDGGAQLSLGEVTDTARVTVNGVLLPLVDPNNTVVDLAGQLKPGVNTIEVRVATPLRNAVKAYAPAGATNAASVNAGMRGPVTLTPYKLVDLAPEPAPEPGATTVTADDISGTYGRATTVTARVTGNAPTGTVTVSDGAIVRGSGTVVNGTAQIQLSGTALPAGRRTLQLAYSGDSANKSSTGSVSVGVAKARTSLAAKLSPKHIRKGKHAKVKVTLAAKGVTPVGQIRVVRNGKVIARGKTTAAGKITIRLPKQSAGRVKLKVRYLGSANFKAATKSVVLRVTKR